MLAAALATFGLLLVSGIVTVAMNVVLTDTAFMSGVLASPAKLYAIRLSDLLTDPVLWIGLACGYVIKRSMQSPRRETGSFLAGVYSPSLWSNRFLGLLLLASIFGHFVILFAHTTMVSLLNSVQHEVDDPFTALLQLLLILAGVSPTAWDPITFPEAHWTIIHVLSAQLVGIARLWVLASIVAWACIRLPSFALALLACFMGLMLLTCYGSLFWPGGLQLPIPFSTRDEIAALVGDATGIPAIHATRLLSRLEVLVIATTLLLLLDWHIRRFRGKAVSVDEPAFW